MAHRIDIELTSERSATEWTWRAVGAREPRGVLAADLLPPGAEVGAEYRADVRQDLDGITVLAVASTRAERGSRFETLEVVGTRADEPLVTSTLTGKRGRGHDGDGRRSRRGEDRGRGDRGGRGDRNSPKRGRSDTKRGRDRADRGSRPPVREAPVRNRLRPANRHRQAVIGELREEERPLAQIVLRGGVPAVRKAVAEQHAEAGRDKAPRIDPEPLVALAETLLPRLRAAEWTDRAEAALSGIDEVDLRDLRSVLTAAESAARTDATRDLAEKLRTGLARRVDREHTAWLTELATTLADGRVVRALRLSSRPPKAGAPLPPDVAAKLAELATAGLTGDISQDRFATVLEAVSFSPIRTRVAATSIPAEPGKDLLALVRTVAVRVPAVAAQFGVSGQKPGRGRPSGAE